MTKRSAQTSAQTGPPAYDTRPLDASTWDAFAELVERNNGVYGGCWCIAFHTEYQRGVSDPRTLKEELVRAGRAHAALVFDENDLAQGWCQYGSPEELGLKHNREYAKAPPPRARWRITCIFVDKGHRGRGVARAALEGALAQIAAAGRRSRRGDLRGDRRTGGSRPVPLQRNCRAVRAVRVREGTAGWQARMDREPRDRVRITRTFAAPNCGAVQHDGVAGHHRHRARGGRDGLAASFVPCRAGLRGARSLRFVE